MTPQNPPPYRASEETPPRLGCDLTAHRDLGLCAHCTSPGNEIAGWRLRAMIERGVPKQPFEGEAHTDDCPYWTHRVLADCDCEEVDQ